MRDWKNVLTRLVHVSREQRNNMQNIVAIILAAGKGKRMKSINRNKVVLKLANKHMIVHAVDLLDKLGIKEKIVVVGFAKESVIRVLGSRVNYAIQKKRLGTAHAVGCALEKMKKSTTDALILQGDDSALYQEETIRKVIDAHKKSQAALTFLTIDVENPFGLGRIVRNESGEIISVVEEKDATNDQKKIKEINPACYLVTIDFLKKYLKKIKKSQATGEYYLTGLIDLAIKNKENINIVKGGKILWRGVNTPEELREAEELLLKTK